MVKIEVGEAYMTRAKCLALVYSYQPDQFPADYADAAMRAEG